MFLVCNTSNATHSEAVQQVNANQFYTSHYCKKTLVKAEHPTRQIMDHSEDGFYTQDETTRIDKKTEGS